MSLSPRLASTDAVTNTVSLDDGQLAVRDRILARFADGTYTSEPVPCFCGDDGGMTIAERDRYGLPVTTLLCPNCALMRTSPRMTSETTRKFYEDDYRELYTQAGKEVLFAHQRRKGQMFADKLTKVGLETVYEIGCGAGGLLSPFARAGCRVVGCDYDDDYLAYGRTQGVDLVRGDVDDLLTYTGGEQADLVMLIHVVEHFLDLGAELQRVARAVKPGGLLLVEVPGIHSISSCYHGDLLLYLQNAHTWHFTGRTLSFVLESVGFDVLSADDEVLLVAQKPQTPSRKLTALPRQEVRSIMHYLAALERQIAVGS